MRVEMTGKTFALKESLKKDGWKYSKGSWAKEVSIPSDILSKCNGSSDTPESREFTKTFGGNKKGCLVTTANGTAVLFRSKEYVAKNETPYTQVEANEAKVWHGVNGAPQGDLMDDPDFP